MQEISQKDMFCIYVTFLEELAFFDKKSVSMVSQIDSDHETRTFLVIRQPANGKAYALSLAAKYLLTYEDVIRRIKR
jgi:thymidine kinase